MTQMDVLNTPLLNLGGDDLLTQRDCTLHISITGVTGGGKTSGLGRHRLTALAKVGAGGVIRHAKPSEVEEARASSRKSHQRDR